MFVAGPPVVERLGEPRTKQELGGWEVQLGCGAVDHAVDTEDEAFEAARRFLSYLPGSIWDLPPRVRGWDDPERREEFLIAAIPREKKQAYHMRRIIEALVDKGSFFEMGAAVRPADHHRVLPAGRLAGGADGGRSAVPRRRLDRGCVQQDHPLRRHGADLPPADRASGGLPGLPGRAGGREQRGDPLGRARAVGDQPDHRALVQHHRAQLLRRGRARATSRSSHLCVRYAWPSASWGSLPLEGGIEAAYRAEIDAAPDPQAKMEEIEARLNRLRSPFRTAEPFWVEEVIDPRETRRLLCEFANMAAPLRTPGESRFTMRP